MSCKLLAAMASDREIRANTEILGEEIGRKSGLGKSAKYRSATFTVSRRKSGGGIIHGILAFSSITLGEPRRWRECFFLRQWCEANGAQLKPDERVWQIESSLADMGAPWMDQQLIRGEIYCRFVLQCAVQCLLLWSVTSPLSTRALLGCLKHSRILSGGIAGSIFMPFRLIRPASPPS